MSSRTRPFPPLPVLLVLAVAFLFAPAVLGPAQVRPVYSQGAAGIFQQIEKLRTTASVMVVGAHPDDGEQFFTRTFDFGFSKMLAEASRM
jgi:hypothetical protein